MTAAATPVIRRHRRITGLVVMLAVVAIGCLASLAIGSQTLSPANLLYALTHRYSLAFDSGTEGLDPAANEAAVIVQTLRIPRTLLALVAGAALGTAGALTQGHTRNPIAEPGLLGVAAGSSLAVVVGVSLLRLSSPLAYVWFALLGGLAAAVVVFAFANLGQRRGDPLTLVLLGVGISATLGAITSALSLADRFAMDEVRRWAVGSVAGRGYEVLATVTPFIVVGLVVAVATGPTLNLLNLGTDIAQATGINLLRARLLGLATLSLLTGAATAACGPIVLLGLVVPHVTRIFTGPDYRWLLPYSTLAGAGLLLSADVVGRVLAPSEVPAGLVIALVGSPLFIALIRRRTLAAV